MLVKADIGTASATIWRVDTEDSLAAAVGALRAQGVLRDASLVHGLQWHGALSVDYLSDGADGSEQFVDVNPRLAEPGNALSSGLNLPMLLVRMALGERLAEQPPGRIGMKTHMGIQAVVMAATRGGARTEILRTIASLMFGSGIFRDSLESLTPVRVDPPSLAPLAAVTLLLLSRPSAWHWLAARQVGSYALTDAAARVIRQMPNG